MMSLWFVVPAHGRADLTRVCLRVLADTCETLTDNGIQATAVVVGDDENMDTARDLGFGTIEQDNTPLGRKLNDGYQLAADPAYNPRPADYVVPFGSDDWIQPWLLLNVTLPKPNTIMCFSRCAVVSEDGSRIARLTIPFAGVGVRVIPTQLLEACGYRPAPEDQSSGLDRATLDRITKANKHRNRLDVVDNQPLQIIDWKTRGGNIHSYDWYVRGHRGTEAPWAFSAGREYPEWALDEMRAVYEGSLVAA